MNHVVGRPYQSLVAWILLVGAGCGGSRTVEPQGDLEAADLSSPTRMDSAAVASIELGRRLAVVAETPVSRQARSWVSLGCAVMTVPDLDGDGIQDLICSAPLEGMVAIVSSSTSRPVWLHEGSIGTGERLAWAWSTMDGRPEFVVAMTSGRGFVVVRPRDDQVLLTSNGDEQGCQSIALAGRGPDVYLAVGTHRATFEGEKLGYLRRFPLHPNGRSSTTRTGQSEDSRIGYSIGVVYEANVRLQPLILTGVYSSHGVCGVQALDAELDEVVYEIACDDSKLKLGHQIVTIPDFDADGCEDVVVVAPAPLEWEDSPRRNGREAYRPQLRVHSGRTGTALRALDLEDGAPTEGYAAAYVGDVDGDRIADVAVTGLGGMHRLGRVSVYSIASMRRLWSTQGPMTSPEMPWAFGSAVCGGMDFNGDGVTDIVVGAGYSTFQDGGGDGGGTGGLFVYSGSNGTLLELIDRL